jgi:hypothetical protein
MSYIVTFDKRDEAGIPKPGHIMTRIHLEPLDNGGMQDLLGKGGTRECINWVFELIFCIKQLTESLDRHSQERARSRLSKKDI